MGTIGRGILICLAGLATQSLAQFSAPAQITVATDDNYPPYLFRAESGQLQGILAEKWALWSSATGVPANVEGMAWARAQNRVLGGGADVIEALGYTEARAKLYDFSLPYAKVEARVFYHRSISAINNAGSLSGFTVGAKEGSACAIWLAERGVETIRPYPNSEDVMRALRAGEIRMFCMDVPTAQYFLLKHGLSDEFRQSPPFYETQLHWAVRKGRAELRDFIEKGMRSIDEDAFAQIDTRWIGKPLQLPIDSRYFVYAALLGAALLAAAALLILWNRTLRVQVAVRTAQVTGQKQVLEHLTHDLGERVKELAVLHAAARLFQGERAIDGELLGELVLLLPAGWQFPDICVARIVYGSMEEQTPGWRDSTWRQSARFGTGDGLAGLIEVSYLEERPADAEGPFLAEERRLIDSLAELIGEHFERNRTQSALRMSEARLMLSVRASGIGLWDWNIVDHEVYRSTEWKRQLGYRDDEIQVRFGEWESLLHPGDRAQALAKLHACLRTPGLDYENEFRMRHKDGTYRWIYARGELQRDAQGNPQRMLGCHMDITDRKRAEEGVRLHAEQLRALSQRLMEVEEIERRNINRELHDGIAQNLSALQLNLGALRMELAESARRTVIARLDDAQSLLESTSYQVRDVMAELRPAALDDFGLLAALREHAATVSARLGIAIAVKGRDIEPRLPLAAEIALFRIVQEALNNVAKHARARRVEVTLAVRRQIVSLSVVDDGAGFDVERAPRRAAHYGIATMRERAEAAGASLTIEAAPGKGTRVVVELERSPAAAAA